MHDSLAIVVTVSWIRLERMETDRNGGIQGEETRRDLIIRSSVDTSDTLIPGPDTRSSGFFFFCEKYRSFYTRYKRSYYVTRRGVGVVFN